MPEPLLDLDRIERMFEDEIKAHGAKDHLGFGLKLIRENRRLRSMIDDPESLELEIHERAKADVLKEIRDQLPEMDQVSEQISEEQKKDWLISCIVRAASPTVDAIVEGRRQDLSPALVAKNIHDFADALMDPKAAAEREYKLKTLAEESRRR